MTIQHPRKRTLVSTVTVLCVAVLSWSVYEFSASIGNAFAHELVAKLSGTAYFLAVAFGAFYVYVAASLDDAPLTHRVIAALTTPFLWMSKECVRLFESHPLVECLYYYLNPLNLWLLLLVVLEMAVATLVVRRLRTNRGERTPVLTPAPLVTIALSLSLVIGLYAWGRGENMYVLFLSGYRGLFGTGVSVRWDGAGGVNRETVANHATGPSRAKRAQDHGDQAASSADRPDIVFILGDNHNAETMGCAGHPAIETPALDRLAREPYITEEVTEYAIEFIEQAAAKPAGERRPFAVYLSHRPGHPPYQAPEGIDGMYDETEVREALPPSVDSWWFGKTRGNVFQGSMMGSYFDQYRGYLETLTAMDADIERLLERIDALGLTENTVVVYMGDNGMQWGTHGRHGIREPYEDCAKLPMLVRAPRIIPDPGTRRDQIALNIDIAPTFLELAGVDAPDHVDGESLLPILRDGKAESREAFLMEFWRYYPENTPSYRGVRTQRYKYIEFEKGRDPWLFDIAEDPDELRTLYGTAEGNRLLPEVLKMLERLQAGNGL